jgi:nucleoside-diphosphate-sugar epimerase
MGDRAIGKTMKILVTGATSMIGRRAVEELLRRGHTLKVLQRGATDLPVTVFQGDIRDASLVRAAIDGCDVVVHAAARVGLVGSYEDFYETNVVGTLNVMNGAVEAGCRGVVYLSSPSVSYSTTPVEGEVSPPARDDVLGFYSQTKSIAERHVISDSRIATVALRPHLVWGPGDTQLVGRIVERAQAGRLVLVNKGRAVVDSTYVDNVSDAIAAAVERIGVNDALNGRALVVSNGEPRTVAELVKEICTAFGLPFEPKSIGLRAAVIIGSVIEALFKLRPQSEPPLTRFTAYQLGISHWFDISETKTLLDWTPRVSLDEGFQRLRGK